MVNYTISLVNLKDLKMNKKIIFLGALIFSGNALASDQYNSWYAGARVGATYVTGIPTADDTDFGGGVFLGYNITEYFGLETAYTHLGDIEITKGSEVTTQVFDVVAKFTLPMNDSLDLFAKGGGGMHFTDGGGTDDSGPNITGGFGTEYHFTDALSARLEYQFYRTLKLESSDWHTHLFAVGLAYGWGAKDKIEIKEAPVVVAPVVEEAVIIEEVVVAPVVVPVEKVTKIVNQTADITFGNDQSTLTAESAKQLDPIIKHLADYPEATIVVIGHTDSRGSAKFNQKLSEKRAEAVSKYLMTKYSIDPKRIRTVGAGESDPIATNKTKEGQAKNRRVSVFSPSLKVTVE